MSKQRSLHIKWSVLLGSFNTVISSLANFLQSVLEVFLMLVFQHKCHRCIVAAGANGLVVQYSEMRWLHIIGGMAHARDTTWRRDGKPLALDWVQSML